MSGFDVCKLFGLSLAYLGYLVDCKAGSSPQREMVNLIVAH